MNKFYWKKWGHVIQQEIENMFNFPVFERKLYVQKKIAYTRELKITAIPVPHASHPNPVNLLRNVNTRNI